MNWRSIGGSAAGSMVFGGLMMVPGVGQLGLGGTMLWAGASGGFSYGISSLVSGTSPTLEGNINAVLSSAAFAGLGYAITARIAPNTGKYLTAPAKKNGTLNIGAGSRPVDGAYNIDINPGANGVYSGNANSLSNIATGSQGRIVMANPYGYDVLTPEVYRALQKGGIIEITGGMSNKFFNTVYSMSAAQLEQMGYSLISRGQISNYNPGLQTNGKSIGGMLLEIILQKR